MSKVKFDIGDRVVVIEDDRYLFSNIGQHGTVNELSCVPFVLLDSGKQLCFCQNELEYEHIYNSPLMKALR